MEEICGDSDGKILAPEFYNAALPADLFIFDNSMVMPAPEKLPPADVIMFRPNAPASGGTADIAGFKVSHVIDNPVVLQWKREDPVMQQLNLGDLHISRALLMDKDPGAVELVSAPEGPLVAYKDFGPVRRYFVGFSPLTESNWARLPSLIMFMQNVVEQTRDRHFIGVPQMITSGNPARLFSPTGLRDPHARVRVTCPDGTEVELPARDGVADFGQTDKLGFYEVAWPGAGGAEANERKSLFAVNLLSQAESDIRPRSLAAAPGANVQETTSVARGNKDIWRYLAVAALLILVVEWWAYHRRVG